MSLDSKRVRLLNNYHYQSGAVIYWMSRDQRVFDNWAFWEALDFAKEKKANFAVVFCFQSSFLGTTKQIFSWMLEGLSEVESTLSDLNIPFYFLDGSPEIVIPDFVKTHQIGAVWADFSPLKIKQIWTKNLLKNLVIPYFEVDSHNLIPVWELSPKQEFAAHTIRSKVYEALDFWLDDIPVATKYLQNNFPKTDTKLEIEPQQIYFQKSGPKSAILAFNQFLEFGLNDYFLDRNNPTLDGQSNLSAYLHFGHLSAQRVVFELVKKFPKIVEDPLLPTLEMVGLTSVELSAKAFLEELLIRRELAENFCFYNLDYDNFEGFPNWAKDSLNNHKDDPREYIYSLEQLELGETHDDLWNAAQMEMVYKGKMHGYLRMYWAKKILEWTPSPQKAQEIAIFLNDKYQFDGRDPNGYTGISWSIGGVHDRPWFERPVFGKIRYMNYNGAAKKFSIEKYVNYVESLKNQGLFG